MIAVPTMGSIHTLLTSQLLKWATQNKTANLSFYFTQNVSPHDRARNQVVEVFLAHEHLTHLFFIDSDTIPPDDALDRLLSHDLPFVSGLTPILTTNKETGAYEKHDNCFQDREFDENGKVTKTIMAERNTGLQKIFRCGASCMLISREVFTVLNRPFFKFEYNEDGTKHTRSEDIYFCDSLTEAGIDIYADTDVICSHEKRAMV